MEKKKIFEVVKASEETVCGFAHSEGTNFWLKDSGEKYVLSEEQFKSLQSAKQDDYRANFLWGKDDDSVESLGYEFANAKTEEYQKECWEALKKSLQSEKGYSQEDMRKAMTHIAGIAAGNAYSNKTIHDTYSEMENYLTTIKPAG